MSLTCSEPSPPELEDIEESIGSIREDHWLCEDVRGVLEEMLDAHEEPSVSRYWVYPHGDDPSAWAWSYVDPDEVDLREDNWSLDELTFTLTHEGLHIYRMHLWGSGGTEEWANSWAEYCLSG